MIEINKENFISEVSTGKVLVVFYRPTGCGNCDKMKPVIEEYSTAHPEIKVCMYACGAAQDEVTQVYQFKMFPGIFSFVDGKPVRGYSGVVTKDALEGVFVSLTEIKAAVYDRMASLQELQKQLEFLNNEISTYNSAVRVVEKQENTPVIPQMLIPKVEPVINDPALDTQCDSCQ